MTGGELCLSLPLSTLFSENKLLTLTISGIFIATKAGTYVISAHAQGQKNAGHLRIKKNDDIICRMWVTTSKSFPACTVPTHLIPGDQVKVVGNDGDVATISAGLTGFSAILVHADI